MERRDLAMDERARLEMREEGFREAPRSGSLFNVQSPIVFRLALHRADA